MAADVYKTQAGDPRATGAALALRCPGCSPFTVVVAFKLTLGATAHQAGVGWAHSTGVRSRGLASARRISLDVSILKQGNTSKTRR